MDKTSTLYRDFLQILREELVPAMGCTEPIALAYGAAVARNTLGSLPERVLVQVSGNIIKNVKSVIVPNTGGLRGIPAAVAAGIVAGDEKRMLEVIASVTPQQKQEILDYLNRHLISVEAARTELTFDYIVTMWAKEDVVTLRIANYHTNIVHLEKNGEVLIDVPIDGEKR